ncbi:MAG: hypothetical protein JWQ34_3427 [Mucilaginibacter sp.]|uniref:sterol desaturase family protein n=1 Tax=Mucilaginibacter sp. TaxID=1882438 RepID=UPI002636AD09|nr:sterol desaturase family protein [Mucilaginibacter sp.]MDB5005202.1 hypothetical protein [Mucilaginibacter sp.]
MHQVFDPFIKIFSTSAIRYFLVAGIPFVLCYVWLNEWFDASKIQNKAASRHDFRREILHSLQSTIVFAAAACLVLYSPVKNITRVYTSPHAYPAWWLYVSVVISLIIHDTYFYWTHRLLHHPKLFRHAHLLHHRSTNPSPWTSYSFHIFEACVESLVLLLITVILPMNVISISLFVFIAFMINVYGHLGYEIAPKWLRKTILFEFTNTSVHHNLHHSKFTGNYGLYFRFWDRLMGTEHPNYVEEYDRVQQNRINKKGATI